MHFAPSAVGWHDVEQHSSGCAGSHGPPSGMQQTPGVLAPQIVAGGTHAETHFPFRHSRQGSPHGVPFGFLRLQWPCFFFRQAGHRFAATSVAAKPWETNSSPLERGPRRLRRDVPERSDWGLSAPPSSIIGCVLRNYEGEVDPTICRGCAAVKPIVHEVRGDW